MPIPTSFQIGAKVTADSAAARYAANAAAAGTQWATKYLMSKVDPFDAANAAADRCVANFVAAGAPAIRAGLGRVNKAAVATLVSTQGPTLYNQGISNKGTPKYKLAAAGLIPALQQIAANLPPRGDLEANIARAAAMARGARQIRGQFRA